MPKKARVVVKKEVKDEDEVEAVLVPQADEEELGKPKTKRGRKSASRGKASPKKRRT